MGRFPRSSTLCSARETLGKHVESAAWRALELWYQVVGLCYPPDTTGGACKQGVGAVGPSVLLLSAERVAVGVVVELGGHMD